MISDDRSQLTELISVADVSVRAASQLRLYSKGKSVHDKDSLQQMSSLLADAIAGGEFITSGTTSGLSGSLRPLTWIADIRWTNSGESHGKYEELVEFVRSIRSAIEDTADGKKVKSEQLGLAADFLQSLGDFLGMQADQSMTGSSGQLQYIS